MKPVVKDKAPISKLAGELCLLYDYAYICRIVNMYLYMYICLFMNNMYNNVFNTS